jgi:hypothetical protein
MLKYIIGSWSAIDSIGRHDGAGAAGPGGGPFEGPEVVEFDGVGVVVEEGDVDGFVVAVEGDAGDGVVAFGVAADDADGHGAGVEGAGGRGVGLVGPEVVISGIGEDGDVGLAFGIGDVVALIGGPVGAAVAFGIGIAGGEEPAVEAVAAGGGGPIAAAVPAEDGGADGDGGAGGEDGVFAGFGAEAELVGGIAAAVVQVVGLGDGAAGGNEHALAKELGIPGGEGSAVTAADEGVVPIGDVELGGGGEATNVGEAADGVGAGFGFAQGGEEDGDEEGDDGDDDEELDEGEGGAGFHEVSPCEVPAR